MFFVLFCYSCGILGLCFFSFMDQPSLILVLISLFFAQLWLWVVWSWDTRMAATNSWQGQWPTYTAPSTLNTFLSGGTTYKKISSTGWVCSTASVFWELITLKVNYQTLKEKFVKACIQVVLNKQSLWTWAMVDFVKSSTTCLKQTNP